MLVKAAWQCQQSHQAVTLTSITRSHLQFNMHDFHRGQLFKGKMHSASVLQLLFCFIAFTYKTPSVPPQKKYLFSISKKMMHGRESQSLVLSSTWVTLLCNFKILFT